MELNLFNLASAVLGFCLLLALLRLARGPTLPDRIVALELTSVLIIGSILVQVAGGASALNVDIAIVVALVAFLGTVALSHYIATAGSDD